MTIAIIGGERYDDIRKLREFIFNIKVKLGTNVKIATRGKRIGTEYWVKKYALDFGLGYVEYNVAHTHRTLYSGMPDTYYDKEYHPTQFLHQYDCVVKHCDKIVYFGGIKKSEKAHFDRVLKRYRKEVGYVN
jgi:hypothetical protein